MALRHTWVTGGWHQEDHQRGIQYHVHRTPTVPTPCLVLSRLQGLCLLTERLKTGAQTRGWVPRMNKGSPCPSPTTYPFPILSHKGPNADPGSQGPRGNASPDRKNVEPRISGFFSCSLLGRQLKSPLVAVTFTLTLTHSPLLERDAFLPRPLLCP